MKNAAPRICIASMPFTQLEIPSLAAGSLKAFLGRELPSHSVFSGLSYLDYAQAVGVPLYSLMAADFMLGRAVFGMQIYPENRDRVGAYFLRKFPDFLRLLEPIDQTLALDVWLDPGADDDLQDPNPSRIAGFFGGAQARDDELAGGVRGLFDYLDRQTQVFVDQASTTLSAAADVVVFVLGSTVSTSYVESSLFPSLAVARELKRKNPSSTTVLAGFGGIAYGLRSPLLEQFPFLDHVVEGELERQVLDLVRGLSESEPEVSTSSEVDVDELPVPDFSAYAHWAEDSSLVTKWSIPIESARGCWWDRVARDDDSFATCFFCNRHGLGYREKSPARVAAEMKQQAQRYGHARFYFGDSLVRVRDVESAADEIQQQGIPFTFLQHARAQITPYEILCLWQAGMTSAQIGVEGLSTSYLRRIGKGTTTIQNLQAMKTLYELKITSAASNLLVDFPGATEAEVRETVDNIENYAVAFQPLQASPFWLVRWDHRRAQPRALRNREPAESGQLQDLPPGEGLGAASFAADGLRLRGARGELATGARGPRCLGEAAPGHSP